MRKVLTQSEANELLDPFKKSFKEVFEKSWESTISCVNWELQNGLIDQTSHSKVWKMYQYSITHFKNVFSQHADSFKPVVYNGLIGLSFHDAMFIKFRKLDENFLPHTNRTKQSKAMYSQGEIAGFPSEPAIVTAGYTLDRAMTQINGIYIVCNKGRQLLWTIDALANFTNDEEIQFPDFGEQVSQSVQKLLTIRDDKRRKKGNIAS